MSNSSLIYTEISEHLIEFLKDLHLQDKYITDSILKSNIADAFIFICEKVLVKLVDLLGNKHRNLYDNVIENFVINVYNIYTKSVYHKYDFVSENTMNLSKRSGDKELFSGERSSKENITPIKQALIFLRRKAEFISENPEITSNSNLLDFMCFKSSLILIQYIRFNIEGEQYRDMFQDIVRFLTNELQDSRFELVH